MDVMQPNGTMKNVEMQYNVVKSIERVVLANNPQQTTRLLGFIEALNYDKILDKIRQANNGFAHLDESEYQIINMRFNEFRGVGVDDVELWKRVKEAEIVEMQEKQK